MTGEECTENLLAENKEKVLFGQDEVAILKQDKKEWSSLNLCICFLEGSSRSAYLKTTSFNSAVEKLWGGSARQAEGTRRVAKKKPNMLRPEKASFASDQTIATARTFMLRCQDFKTQETTERVAGHLSFFNYTTDMRHGCSADLLRAEL